MVSENSTKRTQAQAFSYFAFTGNVGLLIGPFMGKNSPSQIWYVWLLTLAGGILSNPVDQYPSVFGNIQFFRTFPYALPTVATGLISASAATLTLLFVKEVGSFLDVAWPS